MSRFTSDPFLITESDGVKVATKGNITISALPEVEDIKFQHKVVTQPLKNSAGIRVLKITLGDYMIFVNNDKFVIAKNDLYPNPTDFDVDWALESILKEVKIVKDDKGRYTFNTPKNQETLREIVETALEFRQAEIQDAVYSHLGKLSD